MQLAEKLNLKQNSFLRDGLFKAIVGVLWIIAKFALVTALCWGFLFVVDYLPIFAPGRNSIPIAAISIVFITMLTISVVACTVGLTKSIYYSTDNVILLTLPCSPLQVFASKLSIFFIFELKRNFSFMVPLFIAYYIIAGYGFASFLWLIPGFTIVSLFTVGLSALLSIPSMWGANIFRQSKTLQGVALLILVGSVIGALVYLISLIPTNIDLLDDWQNVRGKLTAFLVAYVTDFKLLYNLSYILLGSSAGFKAAFVNFLILIGVSAVLIALSLLIVLPIFYKMASKPFEHLKRKVREKKNVAMPKFITAIFNEIRSAVKSTDRIFSNVTTLISVPVLIFLLNKIFLAMDTDSLGDHLIITFDLMITLLVVLNVNCYASSIFSKDGKSSYLIKTQPTNPMLLLFAKLVPNTLFVCLSIGALAIVFSNTLPLTNVQLTMFVLGIVCVYLAHMFYCAQTDIMNPKYEIYATVGNAEHNPNETKATVSAFLIAFIVSAAIFLLLFENAGSYTYHKLFFVALAAMIWRTWLFFSCIKLYYKEK